MLNLKPKEETQSREWNLEKESNICVKWLMASFKQDNMEIASCDVDIIKWEKEIKELQSKVDNTKQER